MLLPMDMYTLQYTRKIRDYDNNNNNDNYNNNNKYNIIFYVKVMRIISAEYGTV